MSDQEIQRKIAEIVSREPRYDAAAYAFIANAVSFTVGRLPAHRHVSARELLSGMRDYAAAEFGVMAREVLFEWGVRTASDVGRIVYLLIGSQLLAASPEDAPQDFDIDFELIRPDAPDAVPQTTLPKID